MNHGIRHAPEIESVGEDVSRPLWSVMIPSFNLRHYLRKTLDSVLAQDPGPELMQIEVVDDCSTKDDPEPVVRECGNGRVSFYRRPANGGMPVTFNTCIQRSRGQLVHILHSDDYVLPGFYRRLTEVAERHPKVALIASRSFLVDEEDTIIGVTERLPELEAGAHLVHSFFYRTPIQCPGVVVRRAFYEKHGGFLLDLPYVLDCEMWARAISLAGGLVTSDVLACYRVFEANDSARVARTADNLRAVNLLNELFAERYPDFDRRQGLHRVLNQALAQAEHYADDARAVAANLAYWKASAPVQLRVRRAAGKLAEGIFK